MLLKEYVRMMDEAGNANVWEDGLHADLDAIQVWQTVSKLICEAPALEDRTIIVSLKLLDWGYMSAEDIPHRKSTGQFVFQSGDTFYLWAIDWDRF